MSKKVKDAYRIVLDDILNSGCEMMVGTYDAKNGDRRFMYGVSAVMDWIAYKVNDKVGDEFSEMFLDNMIKSERKALTETK